MAHEHAGGGENAFDRILEVVFAVGLIAMATEVVSAAASLGGASGGGGGGGHH